MCKEEQTPEPLKYIKLFISKEILGKQVLRELLWLLLTANSAWVGVKGNKYASIDENTNVAGVEMIVVNINEQLYQLYETNYLDLKALFTWLNENDFELLFGPTIALCLSTYKGFVDNQVILDSTR